MQTNVDTQLKFPLIAISGIGGLEVHYSFATLTISRAKKVRLGWYRGMVLITHDRQLCRVERATVLGGAGQYWGFSLTYSRRVKLSLDLAAPIDISLEECKVLIIEAMVKAPHMWVSLVDGPSLAGWQRRIHKAADVETIIGIIEQVVGREIAA
jgi:hypothetical protein